MYLCEGQAEFGIWPRDEGVAMFEGYIVNLISALEFVGWSSYMSVSFLSLRSSEDVSKEC